jgi:diaminohydroxyphosphoribosylaminopyrimidine deaminase/5-amino-6-(5-phosphoribosylamino)uracil reductase
MRTHEIYMHRCIELAQLGQGHVAPNPMVGSVLVYEDKIIGEGCHQQYGQQHAEVNCINSVAEVDQHLIPSSTLYVSLEPCAHYGKTPPCADKIIEMQIPKVVVGCRDPFPLVDGKGIEKLQRAGVEVTLDVLQEACIRLNKRFFNFHLQKRPYIFLKWAETNNKIIGKAGERLMISSAITQRLVHRWRSSEAAVLVGTNTALFDDPKLDARYATGNNPIRMVIDANNKLPKELNIFDNSQRTIIFNKLLTKTEELTEWIQLHTNDALPRQIADYCYTNQIQSILIEGGSKTLQSFIDASLWDEAMILQNTSMFIDGGVPSPLLSNASIGKVEAIGPDTITFYTRNNTA